MTSTVFRDSKPHYELLDALRGVAALLVVWYHIFEGYAFAGGGIIQVVNHGYLAVDFFFLLSGFVLSYAYDDRWGKSLNYAAFFKRRLIRLHPMVVMAAVIGVVTFFIQGSVQWDGSRVATSAVMLALLFAMFMIPAVPGTVREVRGNGEMFPLNGPSWSLFFEYIGNIIYALLIRRMSNKWLTVWTILLGVGLAVFAVSDISGYDMIGVGWTLDTLNFFGGMLRMLFPFSLGMLISRKFRPVQVKASFWLCSALLIALFHIPYIGTKLGPVSLNGVFEALCIICIFPVILVLGASGNMKSRKLCSFLGELSFPLYMVHYPFMYLFYSYLIKNEIYSFADSWTLALAVYVWNILVAWLCLRFYDLPLRRWLGRRQTRK